jgi:hypothetical protein
MRSATPPGSLGNTVKFWDQIWGPAAYVQQAKTLTEGYQPASGVPRHLR